MCLFYYKVENACNLSSKEAVIKGCTTMHSYDMEIGKQIMRLSKSRKMLVICRP